MKGYIKISTDGSGEIAVRTRLEHVSKADKAALLDSFMEGIHVTDLELIELLAFKATFFNSSKEIRREDVHEDTEPEPEEDDGDSRVEADNTSHVVIDVNINQ